MPIKKTVLWGLWFLLFVSCQEEDEQASLLGVSSSLNETKWILQYIESGSGEIQWPPEEFKETMHIYFNSDTTFNAGSPCNAGFGRYVADQEGNIHVKSLGTTYKLCNETRMEWENKFFGSLRETEIYIVEDDQLILLGKDILIFQQGTPPEKPDCFD